jgi:hypothetical protein
VKAEVLRLRDSRSISSAARFDPSADGKCHGLAEDLWKVEEHAGHVSVSVAL